jgi:SAM-dependent methyltransferase
LQKIGPMQIRDTCLLCNTSDTLIVYRKDQWRYLRCRNCGLVSISPRPSKRQLKNDYQDYLPRDPAEIRNWEDMMKPVVKRSADLIESRIRGGERKILDVGCGYGFFLGEMKSRGWRVEGVEISQTGRQYAQDILHIPVYSRQIERLKLPEASFDVITLFYVIEHVSDPIHVIKEVRRILKPGGLLFLRWPHTTPIIKILGPFAGMFDLYHTPYHLYDFSPKTIKRLLMRCGFNQVDTMIHGNTRPSGLLGRWTSILLGGLGEVLYYISGGRILLPGISKTSLAYKKNN